MTLLAIAFGILLRLVQYLADRSLWLDEAFLSLDLMNLSYRDFLHQPLPHLQSGPPLFLGVQKAILSAFGSSEFVLRALPLAAGIASVPLFYLLAKRLLEPWAALVAVSLFGLSSNLIYYASEVKPYGCDVLWAIVLALALMKLPTAPLNLKRLAGYSLLGAAVCWASFPAAVVLTALSVWSALVCWRRGDRWRILRLLPVWLIWLASFLVLYKACLQAIAHNQELVVFYRQFWTSQFADSPGQWLSVIAESFRDPGAFHLPFAAAAVFAIGVAAMARQSIEQALLATLPIFLTLLMAASKIFPFGNRIILFLVPFMLFPVGAGVAYLGSLPFRPARLLGLFAAAAVLVPALVVSARLLYVPMRVEELKPVLAQVSQRRQSTDRIYVYHWTQYPFRYYASRYGFDPKKCVIGEPLEDKEAWMQLDGLRQYGRVWVIVSQGYRWVAPEQERRLLERLNHLGTKLDEVHAVGAAAYLYQMSAPYGILSQLIPLTDDIVA